MNKETKGILRNGKNVGALISLHWVHLSQTKEHKD